MSLSRKLATLISTEQVSVSQMTDVLTKYKLMSLLPSVRYALLQLSSRATTSNTIMIESPFPLGDDAIKKIKTIVGDDRAEYKMIINKKICAGFKARWRGTLYDGSAERIIKQIAGSV